MDDSVSEMKKTGRPSDYTDAMADHICERLACGESLREMCLTDDNLPCERTVYRWLLQSASFCQKYARAREFQAEPHLEDILEIADDPTLEPNAKNVRIDARKWKMSKLAAKKYGDRTLLGSDPDNPLPQPAGIDASKLSVETLRELMEASRAANGG